MGKILNVIYEQDFLERSFGFRPNRSCHDGLKILEKILNMVSHKWMMKFLEHRIEDKNLLRLISRFFKAGIIDSGIKYDTQQGIPQGGVCSPILANIYLIMSQIYGLTRLSENTARVVRTW